VRLKGQLDTDLLLRGSGSDWPSIRNTLDGDGRFEVTEGVLKDVNLAESLLSDLTGIRGLVSFISPRIRSDYREIFSTGDTSFDEFSATVEIGEGRVKTDDLLLATRDYTVRGEGFLTFPNRINATASLVMAERLSRDIIANVAAAKFLANEDGCLHVPFTLRGHIPGARPKVDSKFVLTALQGGLIEQGLLSLFGEKRGKGAAQHNPKSRDLPH
jgi:hypothetical protein